MSLNSRTSGVVVLAPAGKPPWATKLRPDLVLSRSCVGSLLSRLEETMCICCGELCRELATKPFDGECELSLVAASCGGPLPGEGLLLPADASLGRYSPGPRPPHHFLGVWIELPLLSTLAPPHSRPRSRDLVPSLLRDLERLADFMIWFLLKTFTEFPLLMLRSLTSAGLEALRLL